MNAELKNSTALIDTVERPNADTAVVWFTKEGQEALRTEAAEIRFGRDSYRVLWTDAEGEDHEVEFAPGSPTEGSAGVEYARKNPADTAIAHIESHYRYQAEAA